MQTFQPGSIPVLRTNACHSSTSVGDLKGISYIHCLRNILKYQILCKCILTHTHTHTHTHIYIYIHIYIHTHTHIYIYIYTHTHTHIHKCYMVLKDSKTLRPIKCNNRTASVKYFSIFDNINLHYGILKLMLKY